MKRQTVITQKRRGPAPTGKGTLIGVRLQPPQLAALDAWIDKQDASLTRPEAIRAMMETILHILSKDSGEKPAKKAKFDEGKHAIQNHRVGQGCKGDDRKGSGG
jgi:hypothetical protein